MKLDRITRREFLRRAMLGLVAMATWRPGKGTRRRGDKETGEPSPHYAVSPSPSLRVSPSHEPRALSPHEYVTVAAMAALIMPTDDDPGATEAGVADYIDRKASRLAAERHRYATGVRLMDDCSARLFGRGRRFIDLTPEQQLEVLKKTEATLEMRLRPVTSLWERAWRKVQKVHDDLFGLGDSVSFFRYLREDVMAGFYTNPISWAMLGYVGPPQPRGYPHYEDCPPQARR
ncbi:MAG: gluconate 2-dehydrogenase subunit 3 family protein [Anaerolineae bacterium]|nr:gluconate 2-dehydrogenase subunit 3 family protein [Anaerolineae bacterium]